MSQLLRGVYSVALWLALPIIFVRLWWRGRLQPGYREHWGERLACYSGTASHERVIWLHAVSVGEVRAAVPLLRALRHAAPTRHFVVTCMTPTGRDTANEVFAAETPHIQVVYLPYDLAILQRRFLRHFSPSFLVVMETEIWPNLLATCRTHRIPTVLASARLSEKSLRAYTRFAPIRALITDAVKNFHLVAAQSEADANRLTQLGAIELQRVGNLKFDVDVHADLRALGRTWRTSVSAGKRVLLATSTREGEEALLLAAYSRLDPDLRRDRLLVIVPRHPQRFETVAALIRERGFLLQRRSDQAAIDPSTEIWLGDSMGEVAAYIGMCDIAFVGGSLLPLGGQNFIEVNAQGKPAIMGPSTFNFATAAVEAMTSSALFSASDADDVFAVAEALFADTTQYESAARAARTFTAAHAGATQKTMGLLAPLLLR